MRVLGGIEAFQPIKSDNELMKEDGIGLGLGTVLYSRDNVAYPNIENKK